VKLIVGLGNPGAAYRRNRHNIGYQVVDTLAQRHGLALDRKQSEAMVASGMIHGEKVLLAKPQTFMNNSGRAVRALVDFYKISLDDLIVVADDLDLPAGRLRLRPQGGSGGQNGMKSIIQHLGSQEFARLRIGIGRPPGSMDPATYVLRDFSAEDEREMTMVRPEAADALETWLDEGIEAAMNRHNTRATVAGES
jgi:peptidyl-tRNA hydrolase, PTH1 family